MIDQLNVGGAERVLVDLSNILFRSGEQVEVLTLVRPGPFSKYLEKGIRVNNLDRTSRFSLTKLFRLNSFCNHFDIVHVHLRYNFRYVALAKLLFRGKYRVLLHDHFGDIENDKHIPFALKFLLKRERWFVGVSRPLVDWAIETVGLEQKYASLLANIVAKREAPTFTKDSNSDKVKLLFVANFREAKNHKFAIQLIAELKKHLSVEVCFIGQVLDPEFMGTVMDDIRNRQVEDVISVRHDCDDVQRVAGQFDLAIHTAYQESGPLVLIEYLAQGLPFVAFKTGEVAAQINSYLPFFFLADFEIQNWIARIHEVLDRRDNLGNSMKEVYDKLYSSDAYYEKCRTIYNSMLTE